MPQQKRDVRKAAAQSFSWSLATCGARALQAAAASSGGDSKALAPANKTGYVMGLWDLGLCCVTVYRPARRTATAETFEAADAF